MTEMLLDVDIVYLTPVSCTKRGHHLPSLQGPVEIVAIVDYIQVSSNACRFQIFEVYFNKALKSQAFGTTSICKCGTDKVMLELELNASDPNATYPR
jgi:hypothetical protein